MTVRVTPSLVAATLSELQHAGRLQRERLVLWAGRRGSPSTVDKLIVPHQVSDVDYFWVPPASIRRIFDELRDERLALLGQVHSHPLDAFHSDADDRWALVRHVGALSIVLPHFARDVTARSFLDLAAVFNLASSGSWERVRADALSSHLQVTAP